MCLDRYELISQEYCRFLDYLNEFVETHANATEQMNLDEFMSNVRFRKAHIYIKPPRAPAHFRITIAIVLAHVF